MSRRTRIGLGLAAAGAITVALHATRPADPGSSSDCEAIGEGLLRQPANTLSALALVAVGVGLATSIGRPKRLVGIGAATAGTTSALAHATFHPVALTADAVGVIVALLFVGGGVVTADSLDWLPVGSAGALAAIGVAVWAFSRTGGPLCNPDAAIGGHAVWHLLAAAATGFAAFGMPGRRRKI